MTPTERQTYEPSISSQISYLQSAINCGRITVEALALYLEQHGWCCKNLRDNNDQAGS